MDFDILYKGDNFNSNIKIKELAHQFSLAELSFSDMGDSKQLDSCGRMMIELGEILQKLNYNSYRVVKKDSKHFLAINGEWLALPELDGFLVKHPGAEKETKEI